MSAPLPPVKISDLPPYVGAPSPDGFVPITILGTTYKIPTYLLGGGTTPNLQEVTDVGNVTTNSIVIQDEYDSANIGQLSAGEVAVANTTTNQQAYLRINELAVSNGAGNMVIKWDDVINFYTAQLPNKDAGSFETFAMLSDISGTTPTLQEVTDVGATTTNEIYIPKLWLYDEPNDNYGSVHYTDGNFHIEDADGHKLLVIEDGFMQIHKSNTIQSNLYTTDLTETRDHYLPNESGRLALNSVSTVDFAQRCPDNAFQNAHGNLVIGTTQYYGTRTSPPTLIRFPDPNDLSVYQKITLGSSSYGSIEYLAYNATLGKIYACLNTDKLLVINDINDLTDYTIVDITLSVGSFDAGAVVLTDDTYIYIGTREAPNCHFIKLLASDYSEVAIQEWTGSIAGIHSGVWNSDKSQIAFVQNGGVCYGAKVNPIDLSFTEIYIGNSITDDIAYILDLGSSSFNEFIYCPSENRTFGTGAGGFLWDFTDMVVYPIDALPATGCYFDYDNQMLYTTALGGCIETWTGQNLYASANKFINPKGASDVYVYKEKSKFNEIQKVGSDFFVTIWNNTDGKGSLVKIDLIKVENSVLSKTEQVIRSVEILKAEFQGSVTDATHIYITFSTGYDWVALNSNYTPTVVATNSASATALIGSWVSDLGVSSFRLNFASPVTAALDYLITVTP